MEIYRLVALVWWEPYLSLLNGIMISTINFQRLQLAQKCTNENIMGDKSIRGVKLGISQDKRSSNVVTTCCIQDIQVVIR